MTGRLDELLGATILRLDVLGIPDESLGEFRKPRRLIPAPPSMVPTGRAWRLGVLLLDRERHLFATGEITRAIEPGRAAVNRSAQGEQRRADRMAASRGPFPRGEVVNFGYRLLALDDASLNAGSGPLALDGGTVTVRWGDGFGELGVSPIDDYLADRIALFSAT
ncbi:MAG TPA: hypothetical protein VGM94_00235 [Galbitalea sp.]